MSKFNKKGFKGHVVNPPKQSKFFYPAEMTNKERFEWRKERREAQRESGNTK